MTRGGRRPLWTLLLSCGLGAGLSTCTGPNPDYMMDACTTLGQRQCVAAINQQNFPAVCTTGGMLVQEVCPVGASCRSGLCVPPPGAATCERQRDCKDGQVCVPLLDDGGQLKEYCVSGQAGALPPGSSCQLGQECQSAMCLLHSSGKMFCPKICRTELDCGIAQNCDSLTVTVTGVQGTIHSCDPG